MKIGDIRTHRNFKPSGAKVDSPQYKKDVLALFDKYTEDDEEEKLLELMRKKREVNEAAKRVL